MNEHCRLHVYINIVDVCNNLMQSMLGRNFNRLHLKNIPETLFKGTLLLLRVGENAKLF